MNALFASFRHEHYNRDTAERIRRTQRNRFLTEGTMKVPILGLIKPPGVKTDDGVYWADWAPKMYEDWFELLEGGAGYWDVADWLAEWLAERQIEIPKSIRSGRITGTYIAGVTHNRILKGVREHNRRKVRRVNKTGRRKSVKAPASELLTREVRHLRIIAPERYDALIDKLAKENGKFGRPPGSVSKKFSPWPGKHVYCGICGRRFVWGGHGQTDHLMCNGARLYKCWNGISLDAPLAIAKLRESIFRQIEALEDFDENMLDRVRAETEQSDAGRFASIRELQLDADRLQREIDNVVASIASHGRQ